MDSFRRSLEIYLQSLQDFGISDLQTADSADVKELIATIGEVPIQNPASDAWVEEIEDQAESQTESQTIPTDRVTALKVLSERVSQCTRCEELCTKRKQTVFGVGNPNARLCFFGEAPGADEDRLGEPFVGRAGQLLDRIIAACTLKREDVYILNTLKCRPPGNRNPADDEISNCWEYAEQQLEIIQPEVIVCLGSIAARTLLQTKQSIGRLRQQFHDYRGIPVAVTYHPAYLLRTPSAKRSVWDDMKKVMLELGVEL